MEDVMAGIQTLQMQYKTKAVFPCRHVNFHSTRKSHTWLVLIPPSNSRMGEQKISKYFSYMFQLAESLTFMLQWFCSHSNIWLINATEQTATVFWSENTRDTYSVTALSLLKVKRNGNTKLLWRNLYAVLHMGQRSHKVVPRKLFPFAQLANTDAGNTSATRRDSEILHGWAWTWKKILPWDMKS